MAIGFEGTAERVARDLLASVDVEKMLKERGIYALHDELLTAFGTPKATIMRTYRRDDQRIDVTTYGDSVHQFMVISPGLTMAVTGTQEEIRLAAAMLALVETYERAKAAEKRIAEVEKLLVKAEGETEERERVFAMLWRTLGKKRRAKAADPARELGERLDDEAREGARREGEWW